MVREALIIAACLVAGCGRTTRAVSLDALDFEHAFFATLDDAGDVVRVSDAFGVDADGFTYGPSPALRLQPEETRYGLAVFTTAELAEAVGGFDAERAPQIEIIRAEPPAEPTSLTAEDRLRPPKVRAPVPADTRIFTSEETDDEALVPLAPSLVAKLISQVTLELPVEAEYCRVPNQTDLTPFMATADGLRTAFVSSSTVTSPLMLAVHWLSRDRVFVLSTRAAFVVDRGGGIVDQILIRDIPDTAVFEQLRGFAFSPPAADGTRELILVGGHEDRPDNGTPRVTYGRWWRYTFDDGRVQHVSTSPVLGEIFEAAATHADGATILTGEGAQALYRPAGADTFEPLVVPDVVEELIRVVALPDEDRRFVLASRGRLHHYELRSRDAWSHFDVLRGGLLDPERFRWVGLDYESTEGGDFRFVASANRAGFAWRASQDEDWEQIPVERLPPRFVPCASSVDEAGDILFNRSLLDAHLEDGYVHVAPQFCSSILQYEIEERCYSLLTIEGEEPRFTEQGMRALDTRPGEIVVGTVDGGLYTASWIIP